MQSCALNSKSLRLLLKLLLLYTLVLSIHTIQSQYFLLLILPFPPRRPSDLFKSYPQAYLDARDFGAMNRWLRTIFDRDIDTRTDLATIDDRSEEYTSELQSHVIVVCSHVL